MNELCSLKEMLRIFNDKNVLNFSVSKFLSLVGYLVGLLVVGSSADQLGPL